MKEIAPHATAHTSSLHTSSLRISSRTSSTTTTSFFIKQKKAQKLSCHKTKPYLCTHKTKTTVPLVKSRQVFPQGEMVEWSITTVLKTVVPRGTGGSNPSLSAIMRCNKLKSASCIAFLFCTNKWNDTSVDSEVSVVAQEVLYHYFFINTYFL